MKEADAKLARAALTTNEKLGAERRAANKLEAAQSKKKLHPPQVHVQPKDCNRILTTVATRLTTVTQDDHGSYTAGDACPAASPAGTSATAALRLAGTVEVAVATLALAAVSTLAFVALRDDWTVSVSFANCEWAH